jgi:hypothetical protein
LEGDAGRCKLSDQFAAPDGEARRLKPTLHGKPRADFSIAGMSCSPELPANSASIFGFVAGIANLEISVPGSII